KRLQGDRVGGVQPRIVRKSRGHGGQAGVQHATRLTGRRGHSTGRPYRQGWLDRELPRQDSNLIQVIGRGTGLIRSPAPGRARLAPARVCSRHGSAPVLWTGAESLPVSVPSGLSDCVLEPSLSPWARRLDWYALLE